MKNKRRLGGVLAAMVLAIIGTVALVGYVQSAKDSAVADEALVGVYVVDELIPKGASADTIKSSVSLEQIPARLEQPGAITDLDGVGDNVAATDLQPGDQLLAARLVSQELVAEEVTDKVQISALLDAERAVGGSLQKGDLVGVYLSFEPFNLDEAGQTVETTPAADPSSAIVSAEPSSESVSPDATSSTQETQKKSPNVTRLEFQHVLVTNVQTINTPVSTGDDDSDEVEQVSGSQFVITLALSPEQSERFVFATEFGRVWLSNDPATVSDDGTRLITLGNVFTVATS